ncbi:hypothetical protein V8F20_007962 [Naviculisporaceae sp. PSN 640]
MDSDQVSCISGESLGGTTPRPSQSRTGYDDLQHVGNQRKASPSQQDVQEVILLDAASGPAEKRAPEHLNWITAGFMFSVLVDYVLIAIAILFLGLGIGTLFLNNQPVGTPPGPVLEIASSLGPSIFPILFAAIVGRSLRSIGRYRAERNIRLSTMYTLLNSTTMFETLHCQWTLRHRLLTAQGPFWILFTLSWALSPVGGQASLRVLSKQNKPNVTIENIRYADNGPLGHMYINNMLQRNAATRKSGWSPQTLLDGPLESTLLQTASTKKSPVDAWDNIKIPRLDVHQFNKTADKDGWFTVNPVPSLDTWVSLIGVPILNLPNTTHGHAEFVIASSYISLACDPKFGHYWLPAPVTGKLQTSAFFPRCIDCQSCINPIAQETFHTCHDDLENQGFKRARIGYFLGEPLDQNVSLITEDETKPRTIHFGGLTDSISCTARQESVDVTVDCFRGTCQAIKVRRSQSDKRRPEFTALDLWATEVLVDLAAYSIRSDSDPDRVENSTLKPRETDPNRANNQGQCIVASFILEPLKVAAPNIMQQIDDATSVPFPSEQHINSVDPKDFETRAAILLNTYIQLYMAHAGIGGDIDRDLSLYGPEHHPATGLAQLLSHEESDEILDPSNWNMNSSTSNTVQVQTYISAGPWMESMMRDKIPFVAAATNATVTIYTEVYKPAVIWVTLLLVATTFLLALGFYGMWLSFYVTAPDIFDPVMGLTMGSNASILTKDKERTVVGGYSADATSRVRELGDARVRIGGGVGKEPLVMAV